MHFTADRSQTVQGGDTHGSGGVAVRGATGLHPSDIETFELGGFFNQAGHRLGGFAQGHGTMVVLFNDFLRNTGDPFLLGQLHDLGVNFVVVVIVPDAKVKFRFSKISHNVGNRAATNHTEVERDATIPVGQFLNGSDELHHGIDGVTAAFRVVAGVSGHTVERDLVGARTLTGANQFTAFTSRFKDQSAVRFRGAFLQPIVRGDRTRFFVGVAGYKMESLSKVSLGKFFKA